ncbi:MAG: VWA domain-containing protein [Acidobacteriia bacterium]|nr:VWA domain-containing protein [Terriglobia bacterium]MBV8906810.1 VWA domain-containing protein [Terriglobia bacterium]
MDADLTLVPVIVTDEHGRNVRGLAKQNFRVFDGTEQRPIVAFSREDAPVSVGLIFDSSRSMRDKFKAARDAANRLFRQLNPEDEAFLVTVADRSVLRQDFTSNLGEVGDALTFVGPDGTTSLLDGIYLGLEHMKKAHNPRKALVVVSDGGENNSRFTFQELLEKAVESDTLVYTICLFQNPQSLEEMDGPNLLQNLAAKTGAMPFLSKNLNDFGGIMETIGVTLHNQYVLGYYPPDNAPSGKYRKIRVQLMVPPGMPPMQIYSRAEYYMPQK